LICECGMEVATSPSHEQPSEPLDIAWVHHEGYNCYGGHGAMGVPGKSPIAGDHFLPTCKAACEAEPKCEGIVMVREPQPYKCWLVTDVNPVSCFKNTAFDLWQVVPATASEHNVDVPALGPSSTPAPTTAPSRQANVYERVSGVGAWGGWCTCPDGQRYNVGDLNDGCASGPQSLACSGGTPGECIKAVDDTRNGMQVTCLASEHNVDVPALGPSSTPAPTTAPSRQANVYEHVSGVGAWGGWCTCPDGQRYNVGDLNDGCANGPQSLACSGGTPGECIKAVGETRNGMKVTCAAV